MRSNGHDNDADEIKHCKGGRAEVEGSSTRWVRYSAHESDVGRPVVRSCNSARRASSAGFKVDVIGALPGTDRENATGEFGPRVVLSKWLSASASRVVNYPTTRSPARVMPSSQQP